MFRELRRKKKAISLEAAKELLASSRRGMLAVTAMTDIHTRFQSIICMTMSSRKYSFIAPVQVTRWSRSLSPIKCALRYTVTR